MSIGEQIKKRRKELGMSAEDLGRATGRSRATIYRLENGDTSSYTLDTLEAIAHALGVSVAYLLECSSSFQIKDRNEPEDELFERYGALLSALDSLSENDLKEIEKMTALEYLQILNKDAKEKLIGLCFNKNIMDYLDETNDGTEVDDEEEEDFEQMEMEEESK